MRRDLGALLGLTSVLTLIGYQYDFSATAFFEHRWLYHFSDQRTSPRSAPDFGGIEAVLTLPDSQDIRQKRVQNVCQRYRERLYRPHYRGLKSNFFPDTMRPRYCSTAECPLLVDIRHRFLFCFVQKVASTTVKALFLENSIGTDQLSRGNVTQLHRVANDRIRRVGPQFYTKKKMKKFFKAIFVRHPFERLVSVYEDKVGQEPQKMTYFYDKYFKQFASRKNITGTLSFSDFVDYLIETPWAEFDEHWMPYFQRCEVCLVGYDFIGKLETASEDFDAMLDNGLTDMKSKLRRLNSRYQNGRLDFGRVETYFIQLERNQIMALYRIYRFDFELFGYNILNFIDTFDNGTP
ncbi:carbohydrate sulfotransferase 12-like [Varroa jacobsoni]|uniref:Carbohydrate sulfotransferase n=1 Tax=Varroa destructor TaxID=109461 RepID=A0A7M7K2I7_VARDE|nr:carbohydrate sulfotransferase 12-like [Varroa destructor]XP_022693362.1 carbohydrate sulfotransferase 12-like [Varroa jacobsoni]